MSDNNRLPVLVYDGECSICIEWVAYWQQLTGDKVVYQSYQQVYTQYPAIPVEEFKRAIKYIDPGGSVRSGASASFAIYQHVPGYRLLDWCYFRIPGFAALSESAYNFFSGHRGILSFLTHLCWGKQHQPASYALVNFLFLRLLSLVYLIAFLSLATQIAGLVGSEGVLPLQTYLLQLREHAGTAVYWQMPMIFWLDASDTMLTSCCYLGALFSCLLFFGKLQRLCLVLLYLLYLSLFYAGQTFMTFQWDLLLLEAGFLAIFLPTGMKIIIWLYRWLVFRFMFLGGLVKIISRDPSWDNLTALHYHFETQPLPTVFAWYAHHLPETVLKTGVAFTLLTELLIAFLIFAPRRFRMTAALLFIIFQSLIIITGNYNFFNFLTIALCIFLFDDAAMRTVMPARLLSRFAQAGPVVNSRFMQYLTCAIAFLIVFSSVEQMLRLTSVRIHSASTITRIISPWHFVQNYGPFAIMTRTRHEIIIEGSNDDRNWLEYHFKYKPGELSGPLTWVAPHQPRLDWQMWFAALSPPEQNPWFQNLLFRLLTNSKSVTALLDRNPFPDTAPRMLRARYYEYRFTNPEQFESSSNRWTRQYVTEYFPAIRLTANTVD